MQSRGTLDLKDESQQSQQSAVYRRHNIPRYCQRDRDPHSRSRNSLIWKAVISKSTDHRV